MTTNEKLVSVVIPAYNAEKYIVECIESVINQKYRPLEIVVVDDCSTDRTYELVSNIKDALKEDTCLKINLYRMMRNMGAAHVVDFGFNVAKGAFVAWISADDKYLTIDKIWDQCYSLYMNDAEWSYDDTFSAGITPDVAETISPSYIPKFKSLNILFEKFNILRFLCLFWRNPIQGSSFMITKKAYYRYGGFNPDMGNGDPDRDFWFRLSIYGAKLTVIHPERPTVFYRIHPEQLSNDTRTMKEGMEKTNKRAKKLFIKFITGKLQWNEV